MLEERRLAARRNDIVPNHLNIIKVEFHSSTLRLGKSYPLERLIE